MASAIFNIVRKEVKEMVRDPRLLLGMVIVPLLLFPIMGSAMSASFESVEETVRVIDVGIVNMDGGNLSESLISFLVAHGVSETYYNSSQAWEAMNSTDSGVDVFMFIMPGLTENITENGTGLVLLYTPLRTYSITEGVAADSVLSLVLEFQQQVMTQRLEAAFPGQDPAVIQNPIIVPSYSVVEGEAVSRSPGEITGQLMAQSIMMPIILMMLLIMGAQLAATSVAMEKEEKTLETLLSAPVPRHSILLGKIVGVVAVSAIAVLAYVFGFGFYMSSLTSMDSTNAVDLAALGLAPTTTGMVLLAVTLFLSLVAALSLAVLVASFTEDVRSAQALMGVIYAPIFIPAIILMMLDISQLPAALQGLVYAIPFSYPVLASKAMYTGHFGPILLGIIYQVAFTGLTIYLAARLFSSERIFTARLNLKGLGKGRKKFGLLSGPGRSG